MESGLEAALSLLEHDTEGGVFFEENLVGPLFEEIRERGEALVDEDNLALVLVHEGGHGAVGVGVVNKEARDDEIDVGKGEFFVAAGEGGGGCDPVFCELLLAE